MRLPVPPLRRVVHRHEDTGEEMGGGGFEPPKQVAADLQPVPFRHSGIHPYLLVLTIWNDIIKGAKNQGLFAPFCLFHLFRKALGHQDDGIVAADRDV